MEKKKMFEKVLLGLDVREKKILMNLKDDIQLNNIFKDVKKDIDKLPKLKGILKQQKSIKKTTKKLSKAIDSAFDKLLPSHETFVFHCLLDALDKLNYLFKNKTKLIELTQKRLDVSIDVIESSFTRDINFNPNKFDEIIEKEFKQIDIRCSNFLNKTVDCNDVIINNRNIFMMIEVQKKSVKIENEIFVENFKEDHDFLKEILKTVAVGIVVLESVETKFDKSQKKQLKYNFSRIKNIVIKLIKKIELADKLINESEFKNIIAKSFEIEGEIPTLEAFNSYESYLVWLKKKNKLKSEIKMLKDMVA